MSYPELPGYEITDIVGKGAMGCVYRGRNLADGQDVAIKTLLVDDPSLQRALANEWEVLSRVEHPYLINEREIIQHKGHNYLVMEYVKSQTLTDWVASATPSQRQKEGTLILEKLCQVLTYLHSLQPPVIVRDLKPDNILLLDDTSIKLIDFGIARALEGGAKTEAALKGFASANYAPLEQYSSNATTGTASDIYSLGATAYYVISGQPPMAAIDFLQQGKQPQNVLLELGIGHQWADLIGAAMRTKASQRISLDTFQARLPQPQTEPSLAIAPATTSTLPRADVGLDLLWMLFGLIAFILFFVVLFL